jgi:hypothetical protein
MFVLRKEQTEKMRASVLASFEEEMALHCREIAPRRSEALDDAARISAAQRAIGKAGAYSFTQRGPIRLIVELSVILGFAFDTDPQYPWAAAILGDVSLAEGERAARLYERSLAHTERISGPDQRHARSALERAAERALSAPLSPRDLLSALPQEARAIYPQKANAAGKEALASLVREASSVARDQGIPQAAADVFWIMFLFGHGFVDDPFLPQMRAALHGQEGQEGQEGQGSREPRGAEERAEALRREARRQIDRSLAELDDGVRQ